MSAVSNTLSTSSATFQGMSARQLMMVETYLLEQIAGISLTPNQLSAAAACFACIPDRGLQMVKTYLLNQILSGSGGGGGTGDSDVDAFISCSGIINPTQISAVLTLTKSLKSNNLWTSFDAIYPFVGGNASAHSCNLRNPNQYRITWHGVVTHNANGINGDGSSGYGDTGLNPSTASGQFSSNSASMGVYSKTVNPPDGNFMGCEDGTNQSWFDKFTVSIVNVTIEVGGFNLASTSTVSESNFSGNIDVSRTGASAQSVYSHAGTTAINQTASGLPNASIYILAENKSGLFNPLNANLAFAFIGSGFTSGQVATLQTIITAYQTTLGRA